MKFLAAIFILITTGCVSRTLTEAQAITLARQHVAAGYAVDVSQEPGTASFPVRSPYGEGEAWVVHFPLQKPDVEAGKSVRRPILNVWVRNGRVDGSMIDL